MGAKTIKLKEEMKPLKYTTDHLDVKSTGFGSCLTLEMQDKKLHTQLPFPIPASCLNRPKRQQVMLKQLLHSRGKSRLLP